MPSSISNDNSGVSDGKNKCEMGQGINYNRDPGKAHQNAPRVGIEHNTERGACKRSGFTERSRVDKDRE